MDVRIGFADTARELVIRAAGSQEEVAAKLGAALSGQDGNAVLELDDEKGRKYLIRTERLVYAEIGAAQPHPVGFAGA